MNRQTIDRKQLHAFSTFSAAFGNQAIFSDFLQAPFHSLSDLQQQATLKKDAYPDRNRAVLCEVLQDQLSSTLSESQQNALKDLAKPTTFTIATGHQLTLFGGPLYLIYKVLHVVKLAQQFNDSQSAFKAVPIFWMASEDHDLDEVRSTQLFQQKLTWETTQTGPVGRMEMEDFSSIHQQFSDFFEGKATAIQELLDLPLQKDYAAYMQLLLSKLFADFGVLVIQPDDERLKQLFRPVLERELMNQPSFEAVQQTNMALQKAGWNPQAQARNCNLFYLSEGKRSRIDVVQNGFAIDGTIFSLTELLEKVSDSAAAFSPNVILRPVYQETILPNLAYIGGGGEMAYWIQLKGVFDAHQTIFPLIQQRNSVHLIDAGMQKRMDKVGFEMVRFFEAKEQLRKAYLLLHDADQLNVDQLYAQFEQLKITVIEKAKSVDVTLESFAEAEMVRMRKQIESIEGRMVKQVKQQHEQALKSIDFVCERFLPENTLQERYFHWLHFAPSGDYKSLLDQIYAVMEPFEAELIVLNLK